MIRCPPNPFNVLLRWNGAGFRCTCELEKTAALVGIYRLSNDPLDLVLARESAAKEHDPIKRASAWMHIGATTKDADDFVQAETAMSPQRIGDYSYEEMLGALADCYARAGNFVSAFRTISRFSESAECQASNALIAIARVYATNGKLRAAMRTVERIGSPFWRARGFLTLYADVA